jgi:hypothetical protein
MSDQEVSKHDQVLVGLVISLQAAVMQHLGKIKNPLTDTIERDLDQARGAIDILEMLKAKCRQNTNAGILRLLDTAVMELQMNYLEERKKSAAGEAPAAAGAESGAAAESAAAETAPEDQPKDAE